MRIVPDFRSIPSTAAEPFSKSLDTVSSPRAVVARNANNPTPQKETIRRVITGRPSKRSALRNGLHSKSRETGDQRPDLAAPLTELPRKPRDASTIARPYHAVGIESTDGDRTEIECPCLWLPKN